VEKTGEFSLGVIVERGIRGRNYEEVKNYVVSA
jgi:hypothetical protein